MSQLCAQQFQKLLGRYVPEHYMMTPVTAVMSCVHPCCTQPSVLQRSPLNLLGKKAPLSGKHSSCAVPVKLPVDAGDEVWLQGPGPLPITASTLEQVHMLRLITAVANIVMSVLVRLLVLALPTPSICWSALRGTVLSISWQAFDSPVMHVTTHQMFMQLLYHKTGPLSKVIHIICHFLMFQRQ
jgi:hypothetical protein